VHTCMYMCTYVCTCEHMNVCTYDFVCVCVFVTASAGGERDFSNAGKEESGFMKRFKSMLP